LSRGIKRSGSEATYRGREKGGRAGQRVKSVRICEIGCQAGRWTWSTC
jgi:hypothetical protein